MLEGWNSEGWLFLDYEGRLYLWVQGYRASAGKSVKSMTIWLMLGEKPWWRDVSFIPGPLIFRVCHVLSLYFPPRSDAARANSSLAVFCQLGRCSAPEATLASRTSSLGLLDRLPMEILSLVLGMLDTHSVPRVTRVSFKGTMLVRSHLQHRT